MVISQQVLTEKEANDLEVKVYEEKKKSKRKEEKENGNDNKPDKTLEELDRNELLELNREPIIALSMIRKTLRSWIEKRYGGAGQE